MYSSILNCLFVVSVLPVSGVASEVPTSDDVDPQRLFAVKIQPLLRAKCYACHGEDPDDLGGEFSLVDRPSMLRGGESGPGIVPGHGDEGTVAEAIAWEGLEMPPKENDRFTEEQVRWVRSWIDAGAPWPDEATIRRYRDEDAAQRVNDDGERVTTSGGTSAAWTDRRYDPDALWPYRPLRPVAPEEASLSTTDAIDRHIDDASAAAGLTPAPAASPLAMIRRVTFDLTGLPPTPHEIDDYLAAHHDDPEAAYEALVDRLLASPRYGEHAARQWFDVTRYADTGGMANDYERSNFWRYRDYVIRSFNDDRPYDDFIVQQIAGDELADASVLARTGSRDAVVETRTTGDYTPEEAEAIVATGFLRIGPFDDAMVMEDEARQIYLDDAVNIIGQTFLSTTMRCCRCHDHKFDPIPTRDYYRMYAALATTQMAERPVPFLDVENREGFEEERAFVRRMLDHASSNFRRLNEKQEAAARQWYADRDRDYRDPKARKDDPDDEKPPRGIGLTPAEMGVQKQHMQDEWIWTRRMERFEPMAQSVYNTETIDYPYSAARKLRIKPAKPDDRVVNHILTGGALSATGDEVTPGVLSVVGVAVDDGDDPWALPATTGGRRLALARWLARPDNALAVRSIVNRVWQWHFGIGLAGNANNFGGKGDRPSHPELLDRLSNDFLASERHFKSLRRSIVMSNAYRRSSRGGDPDASTVDPNNRLLSFYPVRRLAAEPIRDAMLAASGELVHADGGLPVASEMNLEVALAPRMIQFSLAPAYQPSPTPARRNRRTVYAYHVRGLADPMNELMGQPGPNESCELRESAAVTPQAFTLLNSDAVTDRSIAMAADLMSAAGDTDARIDLAFRRLLGRPADAPEIGQLSDYLNDMTRHHAANVPPVTTYPTRITRSLVEEFTGETFEYEEILPAFERYQPDRKPSDVDAETRALADVCLLLMNTNEFMYLD